MYRVITKEIYAHVYRDSCSIHAGLPCVQVRLVALWSHSFCVATGILNFCVFFRSYIRVFSILLVSAVQKKLQGEEQIVSEDDMNGILAEVSTMNFLGEEILPGFM